MNGLVIETAWADKTEGFLRHLRADRRSDAHILNVTLVLRRFGESIGGKDPASVTKADVEGWLADLHGGLAPSTVTGYFTILKSALRYWNEGENPACLKGMKAGARESRVRTKGELLTEDEYRRLLSVMPPDKAVIFRLLWDTGARPGEILRLRREDVDFRGDGDADLSFRQTKVGKPRTVPVIEATTLKMLRAHLAMVAQGGYLFPSPTRDEEPLRYIGLWRYLNRVKKRVGITKRVYPYLFRHTAVTRRAKLPGGIRRKMMGWAPGSKVEANYEHLETEDVRDALREMEGDTKTPVEEIQRLIGELNAILEANPEIGLRIQPRAEIDVEVRKVGEIEN